jgi:hypothetical protein
LRHTLVSTLVSHTGSDRIAARSALCRRRYAS